MTESLNIAAALRVMAPTSPGVHDANCFERHLGCAAVKAAELLEYHASLRCSGWVRERRCVLPDGHMGPCRDGEARWW